MDDLLATSKRSELKKTLNVFDLIVIGIGAVVGTGIFTIIGTAITGSSESAGAGPAIVISMVLAAIACIVPALCYSEIAAMIPITQIPSIFIPVDIINSFCIFEMSIPNSL